METDELLLRLRGARGHMDARGLQQALRALIEALSVSVHQTGEKPSWVISHFGEGSINVAIRPGGIVTPEIIEGVNRFTSGLDSLGHEPGIPPGWDEQLLRLVIDMADVVRFPGIEGAEISWVNHDPLRLDREVLSNAQESLSARRESLGSVRGRLDRYLHRGNKRETGLVEEVTGEAITAVFGENLQTRVAESLERNVLAWGLIRRNARGQRVRLEMEDFQVVEDVGMAPPVDAIVGVLGPEWTGGEDSVTWVREQRRDD